MPESDDHRHCKVCGKVCPSDVDVCSKPCRTKREQMLATKRTYTYMLYGAIAFLILVFSLSFAHL